MTDFSYTSQQLNWMRATTLLISGGQKVGRKLFLLLNLVSEHMLHLQPLNMFPITAQRDKSAGVQGLGRGSAVRHLLNFIAVVLTDSMSQSRLKLFRLYLCSGDVHSLFRKFNSQLSFQIKRLLSILSHIILSNGPTVACMESSTHTKHNNNKINTAI